MNGYEIGEFKLTLIRKMIQNEDIVQLIDPNGKAEYPDDLIYKNIFPYNRIPVTEQEVETYVTVRVNVASVPAANDITRKMAIIVRVYAHADLMRVKGSNSNRVDLLSAKIDEILNESQEFGIGYVVLSSSEEGVLDSTHFYRELVFKTDSLNSRRYGAKQWT